MDYIEVTISGFSDFDPEIVMAQLGELGFESFTETDSGIQGYVREDQYEAQTVEEYLRLLATGHGVQYSVARIEDQNWNALWESAYEPVMIAGKCLIRAPFHPADEGMEYEIIIEPKMSFGTAHHATTSMMLALLMQEAVEGKRLLDMGCGTGVLAILAHKMKALEITAIDNDTWAFANATDNFERNGAAAIRLILGEADAIPNQEFDIILANINRNVLLQDIPLYAVHLSPKGTLLLSGFYEDDLEQIKNAAADAGLHYKNHITDQQWVGAKFMK